MPRVSEKLPTLFVGTRSGTWLKTMGDLWAPLPMCIATQKNCKVAKTKCPNIFIHTMRLKYQCMVYNVHKVCLFLYHSFWITLYVYDGRCWTGRLPEEATVLQGLVILVHQILVKSSLHLLALPTPSLINDSHKTPNHKRPAQAFP